MVIKKPRIVIIGAGMAGLAAANKLYKSGVKKGVFELCVVEGGNRIGGRIHTSEFGNDRIELGATWIHGIEGSPVYKIAQEIESLESDQPWECMNGCLDNPITIAENGYVLDSSIVNPISSFFNNLMDSILQGDNSKIQNGNGKKSVGSFLEKGLNSYLKKESRKEEMEVNEYGEWNRMTLEESIFEMNENDQRTSTAANDLHNLDYSAEREYVMFPGDEITIPKGYSSVIESLASVLPLGVVQLGKKVCKIEWENDCVKGILGNKNVSSNSRPVKIHFLDGSSMSADHVVVTVSLGVLKAGIFNKSNSENDLGMFKFDPPLPKYKIEAISRLGYGVVNKLFLKSSPGDLDLDQDLERFPFLQMVFHKSEHQGKNPKIPWWIRKTTSLSPIYENSSVLLCWFAGEEALELETLPEEVILDEVSTTISSFFPNKNVKFDKILKSGWGSDPLFKGSYSYIAIGSSIDDLDSLAKPLPNAAVLESNAAVLESTSGSRPLQILFAGEATHRTHYSTTHGAYFSGIREANRLLEHYNCIDV